MPAVFPGNRSQTSHIILSATIVNNEYIKLEYEEISCHLEPNALPA